MDDLVQLIADRSREILTGLDPDGIVMPMVFSPGDDELVIVPIGEFDTNTPHQKEAVFGVSIGLARALGSSRLVTITDAWYTDKGPDEPMVAPSLDPDRQEALMINDSTVLGITTYIMKYTRDADGKPIAGEWEQMPEHQEGLIVDLLKSFTSAEDDELSPAVREGARIVYNGLINKLQED